MSRRSWIKIHCDGWLRKSIRKESYGTRAVFTDLLVMAGDSAFGGDGMIQFSDNTGFTDENLSSMLNIPLDVWLSAKDRLSNHPESKENRIQILQLPVGFGIKIINWKQYQSEFKRQQQYRAKVTNNVTGEVTNKVTQESYNESNAVDIDIDIDKYGKPITQNVIFFFNALFEKNTGKRYALDFRKDCSIISRLLKIHPENELKDLMVLFFKSEDEFIKRAGYTIGVFSSVINKLASQKVVAKPARKEIVFGTNWRDEPRAKPT